MQLILSSPDCLPLQTPKSNYIERILLMTHIKVCTIKVPLVDCCSWILFGFVLRVTSCWWCRHTELKCLKSIQQNQQEMWTTDTKWIIRQYHTQSMVRVWEYKHSQGVWRILVVLIQKDIYKPIAALLTTVKIQKHPKCPSTDEWMKKMWYVYI